MELLYDSNDGEGHGCVKYKVTGAILIFILAIVFSFSIKYTYKFILLNGFRHKSSFFFLVFLNISIVARVLYFTLEVALLTGDGNDTSYYGLNGIVSWSNFFFIASAISFNMFNWYVQLENISRNAGVEIRGWVKVTIHIVFAIYQLVFFGMYVSIVVFQGSKNKSLDEKFNTFGILFSIFYLVLAPTFIILGIFFYNTMKKSFEWQARKIKGRIYGSISTIAITVAVRGVYDLFVSWTNYSQDANDRSLRKDDLFTPIFTFALILVIDIIPMVVLILSVRYTLMHRNQLSDTGFTIRSFFETKKKAPLIDNTKMNEKTTSVGVDNNSEDSSPFA